MFVGRKEERKKLETALRESGGAVLIYGKRKVGKTTLIKEVLQGCSRPAIYYECIKSSLQENLDSFTTELLRLQLLPAPIHFSSFPDAFTYLNRQNPGLIIVIDEYPYLKTLTAGMTVDSLFQNIIDNHLENLSLILSGSHIGMMREMLEEGNALYGRFQTVIRLEELNYLEAADFYPERSYSEKVSFYSIFGGSPYINTFLHPEMSLKENLIQTILNENSPVYLYADHILLSDYAGKTNIERIFAALGNGKKRYTEIEDRLDIQKNGCLSRQLKTLTDLGILGKSVPFNKAEDNKKHRFEIHDNLLRFFYTFLYKNRSALQMLGAEAFFEAYISVSLKEFISRQFEEICRSYFSLQARQGVLPGLRNIGSFYYDDAKTKTNGEFDVALDYGNEVTLIEAKFFKQPMEADEIHREAGQVRQIKGLKIRDIGFVSVNGFAVREPGYLYYTGEDLYNIS